MAIGITTPNAGYHIFFFVNLRWIGINQNNESSKISAHAVRSRCPRSQRKRSDYND